MRVVCFPFPGAGIAEFTSWHALLPPDVELCAIQLPGRGTRFAEPPWTDFELVVDAAVEALRTRTDISLVFFGHSAGALVAYEAARALERAHRQLALLVVSAEPAPDMPRATAPIHELPDREFRERVRALAGTDDEIFEHDELMDVVLPALRADFTWYERYSFSGGQPLACPLLALAGRDDTEVPAAAVASWRRHTTGPFRHEVVPGGHFFVRERAVDVVAAIVAALR